MSYARRFPLLAALAAAAALASGPVAATELVEFYHKDLDHYFLTGLAPEVQALDSGVHKGWARTGMTIQSLDPATPNTLPVCRFYGNPARGLDSHFYSASKSECDIVKEKWPGEWLLESDDVFRVAAADPNTGLCPANTKAVYRLYNKRADINHRYTTDPAVYESMIAKGYVAEGVGNPKKPIVFCAGAGSPGPAQPVAGAPLCTITASTGFPIPGSTVTLTATCTESPTTYAWTNCTSSTSNCTATATINGAVTYGVVATNARGSSPPASITLNWQPPAAAGPTCTVTASDGSPTIGSRITLSGSCSYAPSQFEWLVCSALIVDVCQPIPACAGSTSSCGTSNAQAGVVHYALVASNSAGASQKAGVNVEWRTSGSSAPPPPNPPPTTPGTPSCTIGASSTTPNVNSQLTLTASCTNKPTSYQWVNCTSSPNAPHACSTTQTGPGQRTYRVQGVNSAGVGAPAEVTVTWQQPATSAPVCTVSASSPTPYLGSTVLLTANCSQSPTSYQWTGCNSSTSTCQASATSLGLASYSVTASNSFGASAPAGTSVTWTNPPPAGTDFCGSYGRVVRVNMPWGGFLDTHQNGGFPADAVLVARITVPQNANGKSTGVTSVVEYIDPQAARHMTLSPSACDFRGFSANVGGTSDPDGIKNPMAWSYGINPNIFFGLPNAPCFT